MLPSRSTIPLTLLFHPRLTPICRHIFLQFQISSRFTTLNKMGKIVNSSTESSLAESSSSVADSAVRQDPVRLNSLFLFNNHLRYCIRVKFSF